MEVKTLAKSSYNTLLGFSASPREMQLPSMPKGVGYKNVEWPFTEPPDNPYLDDVNQDVDLSGGYDNE